MAYKFLTCFCLIIWAVFGGRIQGVIRSAQSGKTIQNARIILEGSSHSATTDSMGYFELNDIAPGSYNIVVSHDNFSPRVKNDVQVLGTGTKRVEIELLPKVYELSKMTVSASQYYKPPDMASSTKVLDADEMLRAPGALMDIQRIVQNLPSVSSGADNVNEVIVRGGLPGENLFIVDNIEIPNPNHFADQSSGGGVVSIINPLLVQKVTFNAGAPPAKYGGKASSVIDVKLRDGTRDLILGGIDIGFGGAGIHAEGPLWRDASFMVSASKSYLDIASRFAPGTAIPQFWGAQTKISQKIPDGKIYLNGIFGDNTITIDNAKKDLNLEWDRIKAGGIVYATGLTAERFWGEILAGSLTLSAVGNTFDRLTYTPEESDTGFVNASVEHEQKIQGELTADFDNGVSLSGGIYGKYSSFTIDIEEQADTLRYEGTIVTDSTGTVIGTSAPRTAKDKAYAYGGWAGSIIPVTAKLRLMPGIRFDGFSYNHSFNMSPRLALTFSATEQISFTTALGLQHQTPTYSALVQHKNNSDLHNRRAFSATLGTEYIISEPGIKCVVEGFYKKYDHLIIDKARLGPYGEFHFLKSYELIDNGEGRSYGLELFAQKKLTGSFFFTAAWSLSKSQFRFPGYGGGKWYAGDYDFGQVLTLSTGVKKDLLEKQWYNNLRSHLWYKLASFIMPFGDRNEISARFRYLGGRPHTGLTYNTNYNRWLLDTETPNNKRYPDYHRLDVRWERRFGFGLLQLIYYIEFQNIYSRNNIWSETLNDTSGSRKYIKQLPFFPAGGIIIGF